MNLSLIKYSFFAGMLAFAGLPIYLHAPKYFLDNYDIINNNWSNTPSPQMF